MAENKLPEYQTQFTKENIRELNKVIATSINKHAEENAPGGKLDLFLILAALGHSAYEVIIRTLPTDEADAKINKDKMSVLADQFISLLDKNRKELDTKPAAELLAAAHSLNVISEFYSRRRDEVIKKVRKT